MAIVLSRTTLSYATPELEVELDYVTDPALRACPNESAFRRLLSDQLGRDPVRVGAPHRVVARAHGEPNSVVGSVRWHHATGEVSGEREMRGAQCEDLVRAMAFAVAVQIELVEEQQALAGASSSPEADVAPSAAPPLDVNAASQPPAAPSLPSTAAVTSTPRTNPAEFEPTLPAPEPEPWLGLAGVGAGLRFAEDAEPIPEGRVLFGLRHANYGAELGAGGTWPGEWRNNDDQGFRYSSLFGFLALCVASKPLALCSSLRTERLAARGLGVDVPRAASTWLVELGPRLVLFGGPNNWQGALYLEARSAVVPARVLLSQEQVWKSPPWSLTVGLDLAAVWSVSP